MDAKGNLVDWWDAETLDEFTARAKCFVDKVKILYKIEFGKQCKLLTFQLFSCVLQYSKYKHPTLNLMVC